MKTIIRKLLGCHKGACSWRYGYHDFNTISGQVKYRFWCLVEYWQDRPRVWRIHFGNRFALLAARIRGDKLYDLGYGIEGNLAAMLEADIRQELLLLKIRHYEEEERIDELMRSVEILAEGAKAQSFLDYAKWEKSNK